MRKTGHTFHPSNGWNIEDRQAEDRARSEENAAKRQRQEWEAQGRNYEGEYPEPAIVINTTRRWSGNQDWGKNKRTWGEYLREKLADSEEEKTQGRQRHEARKGKSRQRREEGNTKDPVESTAEEDKHGRTLRAERGNSEGRLIAP